MKRILSIKAIVLLTTFVVGSIVAPASHYVFMVFSDAYVWHHAPLSGKNTHPHHPIPVSDSTNVVAPNDHLVCDYADLFATFVATSHPAAETIVKTPQLGSYDQKSEQPALHFSFNVSQSRAPPAYSLS